MKSMFLKRGAMGLVAVAAATSGMAWTMDKTPDLGNFWQPLGPSPSTSIYANSFVFTGGAGEEDIATAGVYLASQSGSPDIELLLLADNANSPTATILSTSIAPVSTASPTLTLVTSGMTAYTMTSGTRYWIAARASGTGSYVTGGHTQNSIYADNGTFWYSNAGDLNNWDGQGLTPEMAIYVETVPEPATFVALGLGIAALALRRRK